MKIDNYRKGNVTRQSKVPTKYKVEDWLYLHNLEGTEIGADSIAKLINRSQQNLLHQHCYQAAGNLGFAERLCLMVRTVEKAFPSKTQSIRSVAETLKVHGSEESNLNLFLEPLISCKLTGTAADVLAITRKLANALQLVTANRSINPPQTRELAALLREWLILDLLACERPELYELALQCWQLDNLGYIGRDDGALSDALSDLSNAYDYWQNYSLAWIAATRAEALLPRETLWCVFLGSITATQFVETFCQSAVSPSFDLQSKCARE